MFKVKLLNIEMCHSFWDILKRRVGVISLVEEKTCLFFNVKRVYKFWRFLLCFDADSALFDASQYAFFGRDIGEEVELGGLDEEGNSCVPSVDGGFGDEDVQEYHLFEKDEVHYFYF